MERQIEKCQIKLNKERERVFHREREAPYTSLLSLLPSEVRTISVCLRQTLPYVHLDMDSSRQDRAVSR